MPPNLYLLLNDMDLYLIYLALDEISKLQFVNGRVDKHIFKVIPLLHLIAACCHPPPVHNQLKSTHLWFLFSILKGELEEDPAPVLDTSIRDLEVRLNRLETRVLACRNRPTDLSTEAMALQLEEAQVRIILTGQTAKHYLQHIYEQN